MSDQYLIAHVGHTHKRDEHICWFWHVGQNTGLKKPAKTIRNNHQLRFL